MLMPSFKTSAVLLVSCLALAACASEKPHVVQAQADLPEVRLIGGMATQIEMPDSERVQSLVTGNPGLVTAERTEGVVNLIPKEGASGETNLIVRAVDEDGHPEVYQYRLIVEQR